MPRSQALRREPGTEATPPLEVLSLTSIGDFVATYTVAWIMDLDELTLHTGTIKGLPQWCIYSRA